MPPENQGLLIQLTKEQLGLKHRHRITKMDTFLNENRKRTMKKDMITNKINDGKLKIHSSIRYTGTQNSATTDHLYQKLSEQKSIVRFQGFFHAYIVSAFVWEIGVGESAFVDLICGFFDIDFSAVFVEFYDKEN